MSNTDWSDPSSPISKHFTVKEATFLPSWGIYHSPSDEEKANILAMASIMDELRDYFGAPINIHVWIRPNSVNCPSSDKHGQDYNAHVGGAHASAHIIGRAVDYDVAGMDCDTARQKLLDDGKLDALSIRMERRDGSNWVHNDNMPVKPGGHAYFLP